MLEFPHSLLREAVTERPRLVGAARTGGRSASGAITTSRSDGGGLWVYGLQAIAITTRELVLTFEAVAALLAEGARPIIMPICDKRHNPFMPTDGSPPFSWGTIPHSDGTLFSVGGGYAQEATAVALVGDALLRAPTLTMDLNTAGSISGGELFSIQHTTLNWRWYRVTGVSAVSGTRVTVSIEPPLREATPAGAHIEFEYPRCVMQLAAPASLDLELRRFGRPSLSFIESFLP